MSAEKEQKLQTETISVKLRLFTHQAQNCEAKTNNRQPILYVSFYFFKTCVIYFQKQFIKISFFTRKVSPKNKQIFKYCQKIRWQVVLPMES